MTWLHPARTLSTSEADVVVTPELAGWDYSGLTVHSLRPGVPVRFTLTTDEGVLVPLSAQDVSVVVDGVAHSLTGRPGVFAAVADWMYLPLGAEVELLGTGGEVAVCTAQATTPLPFMHVAAEDVAVEVRGAGRATRQVTNIATPGSFAGADRINVCEVITPGGNWSSWPPHRHDGIAGCPVANEEIYYFRIGREESAHGDPAGTGLFRVYTVDQTLDETVTVRDGDVYLVPHGYHGPSVAPPEYPMYFLNVLAGPGEERTMAFCDDPDQHWIRESWESQEPDPRLPWTTAAGRTMNKAT
jgi:5-deoxy-glucuronate isomerase